MSKVIQFTILLEHLATSLVLVNIPYSHETTDYAYYNNTVQFITTFKEIYI